MSHGITDKDSMFSVRAMPWHGLGTILDEYPEGIDDALEKSGLTWAVNQGDVFVALPPFDGAALDPNAVYVPQLESRLAPAKGFRANIRQDTGDVLGIVSDDYRIIPNRDAFAWLDELLGGDVQFETAGSLHGGKRVWVLVRLPQEVEVGGDVTYDYIYAANSHDGSMAVTAAATKVRVVCANTLGMVLREADGRAAERTYRFRHTGDMRAKVQEARRVMRLTLDYTRQLKVFGDEMAQIRLTPQRFDTKVIHPLLGLDDPELQDPKRKRALKNREVRRDLLMDLFRGRGEDGDTTGNSPGTKWTAINAVAEFSDHYRRVTKTTDQMHRSFEDQAIKQRGLDLVEAA